MNRFRFLIASLLSASPALAADRYPSLDTVTPVATIHIAKTADWVAVAPGAVWVGSTGPNAVSRIDTATNRLTAQVALPGAPCAGLATDFGALWVPLCGPHGRLAKVDLAAGRLIVTFPVESVLAEDGVAVGAHGVWLVIDKAGTTLARLDPQTGAVKQRLKLPQGSHNPRADGDTIWVTDAGGAVLTGVDEATGRIRATIATGPHPRFLAAGGGAIWTLNQGDGSVTRIDEDSPRAVASIPLHTPGTGGDIGFGQGIVWTTMPGIPLSAIDAADNTLRRQWVGHGGDSLNVTADSVWLTDYHAGTISRYTITSLLGG